MRNEVKSGVSNCSLAVNAGDILDLADKCDAEGKPELAEWLRLEVRHHARVIAWEERMHEHDPALNSPPTSNYNQT